MNKPITDLKKYITEIIATDVITKKLLYQKANEEYCDSLLDFGNGSISCEVAYKRVQLAKIKYAEAVRNERLWQNQKHQLN